MAVLSVNHATVGRRFDRPGAGLRASPAELRHAPRLIASPTKPGFGADARERTANPGFRNAVSLRVQPDLVLTLREALVRARGLKAAFVYGAAAQAQEGPQSHINLMVIGDVNYADCCFGLLAAENLLKRRIHVRFVGAEEWQRKRARKSAFVRKINAQPRLFISVAADDLRL